MDEFNQQNMEVENVVPTEVEKYNVETKENVSSKKNENKDKNITIDFETLNNKIANLELKIIEIDKKISNEENIQKLEKLNKLNKDSLSLFDETLKNINKMNENIKEFYDFSLTNNISKVELLNKSLMNIEQRFNSILNKLINYNNLVEELMKNIKVNIYEK